MAEFVLSTESVSPVNSLKGGQRRAFLCAVSRQNWVALCTSSAPSVSSSLAVGLRIPFSSVLVQLEYFSKPATCLSGKVGEHSQTGKQR